MQKPSSEQRQHAVSQTQFTNTQRSAMCQSRSSVFVCKIINLWSDLVPQGTFFLQGVILVCTSDSFGPPPKPVDNSVRKRTNHSEFLRDRQKNRLLVSQEGLDMPMQSPVTFRCRTCSYCTFVLPCKAVPPESSTHADSLVPSVPQVVSLGEMVYRTVELPACGGVEIRICQPANKSVV